MKLPPNITASELSRHLAIMGSNHRSKRRPHPVDDAPAGGHHIAVPQHQPWKGGAVDAMLSAVAGHFSLDRKELIKFLFD
jgi:hypothetical protein